MDENQQSELKPTDNADQTYELKRINKKLNDTLFHLEKMHKYILVMLIMAAVGRDRLALLHQHLGGSINSL